MALPLQAVQDPATDQNFRQIAQQFPIQAENLAQPASEAVSGEEDDLRIVRGTVSTAGSGSIVVGEGFTIARTGTGNVTVSFSTPFSSAPSVTTGVHSGSEGRDVTIGEETKAKATFVIYITKSTVEADGIFTFIAIGPR